MLAVRGTGEASTSSSKFEEIPGLGGASPYFVHRGLVTLTVNLDLRGAPVDVRITTPGRGIKPRVAHFDPRPGSTSFSHTFYAFQPKTVCTWYTVLWRSPTGKPLRAVFRDYVVSYHEPSSTASIACP
jgi:hypothetical protein